MLSQEQLELRKRGIGGSDVAAICGLSRWGTAMSVYLSKLGLDEPLAESEPMFWGSALEGVIADRFARDHPEYHVAESSFASHPEYPWALGLPDRLLFAIEDHDGDFVVVHSAAAAGLEIKTASLWKKDEWESGPPIEYMLQVQWYMAVTGLPLWYVAVLIGGQTYEEFEVARDDELIADLLDRCGAFWALVEARTPPAIDGSKATTDVLKFLHPADAVLRESLRLPDADPDGTPTDDLARAHVSLKAHIKDMENELRESDNRLMAMMGDYEEAWTPDGSLVTWKARSRAGGIDAKALEADLPDVAARYRKPSTDYRVFVVAKE